MNKRKILYIDQVGGISGDMLLSAVVDLTEDRSFIDLLPLDNKFIKSIKFRKVLQKHILCLKLDIAERKNEIEYNQLISIVRKSKFNLEVRNNVLKTLQYIAIAESKIHNVKLQKFHFHNYYDLLLELFGFFYLLEKLNVQKVYSSTVKFNHGFVNCTHGKLPLPAPAALELSKNMTVEFISSQEELSTPTGVAILKSVNPEFNFPAMKILKVGYGCGNNKLDFPNILRLYLAEEIKIVSSKFFSDKVLKIECNIDDLNPIFYDSLIEKLYDIGCYEVNLINTINKKSRFGILLTVILEKELFDEAINIIFENSTTIGVRVEEVKRIKLHRESRKIKTKYGSICAKVVVLPYGSKVVRPEYDDVKKLAYKKNISVIRLYHELYSKLNYK